MVEAAAGNLKNKGRGVARTDVGTFEGHELSTRDTTLQSADLA